MPSQISKLTIILENIILLHVVNIYIIKKHSEIPFNIGKVIVAIDRIKYITESQIPSNHILHHKHQKCAHYDKDSQLEKLLVYTIM